MDPIENSESMTQNNSETEQDISRLEHAETTHRSNELQQQQNSKDDSKPVENSAALDSDLVISSNDTHNINEINDSILIEDDEFGSFDSGEDNDDFGSFDDFDDENIKEDDFGNTLDDFQDNNVANTQQAIVDNKPIFNTLEEAIHTWEQLLDQLFNTKSLDSFTKKSSQKSIRKYVLEDAAESLRARITWDSVTRYIDNDTGIPKVRWYQSEIEKTHLIALSCERSVITSPPTMIDIASIAEDKPESIETTFTTTAYDTTVISHSTNNNSQSPSSYITEEANNPSATPTMETTKRSSVFGLSTISRYLPNLTKSDLPKSPTSPVSPSTTTSSNFAKNKWSQPTSPLTPSSSSARRGINSIHLNDLASLQGNQMNTANTTSVTPATNGLKRANTVAFSSRYKNSSIITGAEPILSPSTINSSPLKPRPTSFHGQKPVSSSETQQKKRNSTTASSDLFDLNTDLGSILQQPALPKLNTSFKPLIPTFSTTPLSPTLVNPVRRSNTLPSSINSLETSKSINKPALPVVLDDNNNFGNFTTEKNAKTSKNDDLFGDFFSNNVNASNNASGNTLKTSSNNGDPFDLKIINIKKEFPTNSTSAKAADNDDDPFGLDSVMMMSASHSRSKSTSSSVFSSMTSVLSPTQIMSLTPPKSPISSHMQTMSASPIIPSSPIVAHQATKEVPLMSSPSTIMSNNPLDCSTVSSSSLSSVFNVVPVGTTITVNDQLPTKKEDEDDDDWGDWES